ncbi:substance-P receptor-like [Oculina patagonica]
MSLTSNTTIFTSPNETALGQQNSPCIFVDSTAERISKICAYCLILLGSLLGNIFIIIIVYKHRDLRKTVNYFIVNMAVSDLLYPVIIIPVQITELLTGSEHWRVSGILGSIFCKLHVFSGVVSSHVSAQSIVWIALDRFVAVVFPMRRELISTKIRTIAILTTWIVAGLFNFPLLMTFGLVVHQNNTYCTLSNTESLFPNKEAIAAYDWLRTTLFAIAPLLLTTILYTAIVIALKRQSQALAETAPNVQQQSLEKRRQAIKMSVAIAVLFYICVIPSIFLQFLIYHERPCGFQRLFYILAFIMYCSSSIVNPIICLSFVESYRRGLRNIFMRNSEMAKRKQITLKEIKHHPEENCPRNFKDRENDVETLDTVLWRKPWTLAKKEKLLGQSRCN